MYQRKIQTSKGKRKFLHEQQQEQHSQQFTENSITRPPTSHPYLGLNSVRSSSGMLRSKYESNYFSGNILSANKTVYSKKSRITKLQSSTIKSNYCQGVPKAFKHLFAQMRVLLKNIVCEQNQFIDLFQALSKKIRQLDQQYIHKSQVAAQKIEELQKITLQNEKLKRRVNELQIRQNDKRENDLDAKQNFSIKLLNLQLQQKNQAYERKIKELQCNLPEQMFQQKNQTNKNVSETDWIRYQNRINYLQIKIKNSETIQTDLSTKYQATQENLFHTSEELRQANQKLKQLKQTKNQWMQRALMQKQDSESNRNRQHFLLFSIKKLRESNKNLMNKITNAENSDGNKQIKQIQPNPYFQYEVDFFKSFRSVYFDAKQKEFKTNLQRDRQSSELEERGFGKQYVQYRKYEQVDLVTLSYSRPSFYSFIQESITGDIQSCRIKGSTSVSRTFIQLIRSILISKINQFLVFGREQKFSRFPQFVYSWFQKFYFDSERNSISALQPYMQKPISQDVFYRDLMNVRLDQSWEIITFREFLLEELNLEELYFYLMCQNLLYRKSGITNQIQYFGQFCILVEFLTAKSVLDLVLSDFQSWNINFITSKLKQKIILKKGVQFIQAGFFLRCLVEYYKIERINRLKYINKLCDQFKSCEKNGLRFSSFISIINRFTEVSSEEKIRLYRDCHNVGKGKITGQTIFVVCTQQLVFLRYLKLKCFYRVPGIVPYRQARRMRTIVNRVEQGLDVPKAKKRLICIQPSDPYIYDIILSIKRLLIDDQRFSKKMQTFGVSELINHFSILQKVFDMKQNGLDSSDLRCRHFIHFISQSIHKIRQINFQNFYELLEQNNKKRYNSSFWIQMNEGELCQILAEQARVTFKIHNQINEIRLWKQRVYNFRVNNAARKIQRQVKKKFIQPFMQLCKIMYTDSKKSHSKI